MQGFLPFLLQPPGSGEHLCTELGPAGDLSTPDIVSDLATTSGVSFTTLFLMNGMAPVAAVTRTAGGSTEESLAFEF